MVIYIGKTFEVGGETYIIKKYLPTFGAFKVYASKACEYVFVSE